MADKSLSEPQKTLLFSIAKDWAKPVIGTIDRDRTIQAVTSIYSALGFPAPRVVFLPSCFHAIKLKNAKNIESTTPSFSNLSGTFYMISGFASGYPMAPIGPAERRRNALFEHIADSTIPNLWKEQLQTDSETDEALKGIDIYSTTNRWVGVWTQFWERMQFCLTDRLGNDYGNAMPNLLPIRSQGSLYYLCTDNGSLIPLCDFAIRQGWDEFTEAQPFLDVLHAASWVWPEPGVCIVADNPRVSSTDEQGRWHSAQGPALSYGHPWEMWAWHGVNVPQRYIEAPEQAVGDFLLEDNQERRRVLIERAGWNAIVSSLKASGFSMRQVDKDRDNANQPRILWELSVSDEGDPVVRLVEVIDPSTANHYFLRVPPGIASCKEAVAWTFSFVGRNANRYNPRVER